MGRRGRGIESVDSWGSAILIYARVHNDCKYLGARGMCHEFALQTKYVPNWTYFVLTINTMLLQPQG